MVALTGLRTVNALPERLTRALGAATLARNRWPDPGSHGRTVSSSEIAFLALGLVLGGALGAAFLVAGRARLAPRREVRITVAPNSIGARRSVTLADPSAARSRPSPPGSPDEAAWPERAVSEPLVPAAALRAGPVPAAPLRTRVPSAPAWVAVTAVATSHHREREAGTASHVPSSVAVMDGSRADPGPRARSNRPMPDARPHLAPNAVGIPIDPETEVRMTSTERPGGTAPSQGSPSGSVDPCGAVRSLAEQRCAEATASREAARVAGDALRRARREVDTLRERIERAQETSDPRAIAAAKAALHAAFREANSMAKTAEEAEAAARQWLSGIDRANTDATSALRSSESDTATLREQLPELDRLAEAAHAARIAGETAEHACRIAREELARCEEVAAAAPPPPAADAPHPFATAWPTEADLSPAHDPGGAPTEAMAGLPAIVRMLRGDREARDRVVTMLAGDDRAAQAAWQLRMTALVDAIAARAIEACFLDLPDDEPFWALFGQKERRDIVEALSSLGFRFDGISGFADGRAPSARDMSLAVGYAGLDPMRVRVWPREAELGALFDRATVAAEAWLVTVTDDLALGAVVDALGHRAADLGELWDAWGRVRPLLLATD